MNMCDYSLFQNIWIRDIYNTNMADIDVDKLKKIASDITEYSKSVTFAQPQNNMSDVSVSDMFEGNNLQPLLSNSSVDTIQNIPIINTNTVVPVPKPVPAPVPVQAPVPAPVNALAPVSIIKNTNVSSFSKKIDFVNIMGYALPQSTFYLLLCLIAMGLFIYYKL